MGSADPDREGAALGISERLVQTMFVLVPSLFIALLTVSGNSYILQGAANSVFGGYIQSVSLRLYLLEGVIVIFFLVLAVFAIHGTKGNAIEQYEGL